MIATVLTWWAAITIIGWVSFPLTWRLFSRLPDRGFGLSRALGLLAAGYFLWMGSSLGFLRNNAAGAFGSILLLGVVSFYAARDNRQEILNWISKNLKLIVFVEILFMLAFALWAFVRANNPEIQHTEKPMELAFLNSILRSDVFPPRDPWLSGYAISYYYFGYVLLGMLAHLTGTAAGEAFNLGNALWFALVAVGAYSVLYNLLAHEGKKNRIIAPLIAPLFVLVVGNLEVIFELLHHLQIFWIRDADGQMTSAFWEWLNLGRLAQPPLGSPTWLPDRFLWWWQASRVVQDVNLAGVSTEMIDEFPFFSFLLADNHPHLLVLPFVLLTISFSFNLFLTKGPLSHRLGIVKKVKVNRMFLAAAIAGFAVVLGVLQMMLLLGPDSPGLTAWRNTLIRGGIGVGALTLLLSIALGWVEISLSQKEFWIGAWIFGALAFLNPWDLPIYISLFFAVLIYRLRRDSLRGMVLRLVPTALGMLSAAILFFLPWYPGFSSQAGGILPNIINPTRIVQFLIMFLPLLFPIFIWLWKRAFPLMRGRGLKIFISISLGIPIALFLISTLLALIIYFVLSSAPQSLQAVIAGLGGQEGDSFVSFVGDILSRRISNSWTALLLGMLFALGLTPLLLSRLDRESDPQETNGSGVFVILMICVGTLLILGPEFLYLRDSFGTRMNTIFKFYFAGWILLGIPAGYATLKLLPQRRSWSEAAKALVLIPMLLGLIYPILSLRTKTSSFQPSNARTLDGTAYLDNNNPEEYLAINWLNNNIPNAIIAEAIGGSYSEFARISTHTGFSTVLGWPGHELQWRGGHELQGSREQDIANLYTTNSWQEASEIIDFYDIDLVYIGQLERRKYQPPDYAPLNERKFLNFMKVIYETAQVTILALPDVADQ